MTERLCATCGAILAPNSGEWAAHFARRQTCNRKCAASLISKLALARAPSLLGRFEEKFIPEPNSGCWLWIAGCDKGGYGTFKVRGEQLSAHRVSWEIYRGPIPDGLDVLHKCDIRPCVNPAHLFLGTDLDNQRDCIAKGRKVVQRGEANPHAKLTEDQVRAIRAAWGNTRDIARRFGVSQSRVSAIKLRQSWIHVPDEPVGAA